MGQEGMAANWKRDGLHSIERRNSLLADGSLNIRLLWASSTMYIYLSALFHAADFRVTVPLFSRPRYTTVTLISLPLHPPECSVDFFLLPTYIPCYKMQCGKPAALLCQDKCKKRSTPAVSQGLWQHHVWVTLILLSARPPGERPVPGTWEPGTLHSPLGTPRVTCCDNSDRVKFSPGRGSAWAFPHIPKPH